MHSWFPCSSVEFPFWLILFRFTTVHHVQFHLLWWFVSREREERKTTTVFDWYLVECHSDLFVYYSSIDGDWNSSGKKYQWQNELSMPYECRTTTDSREEMVYGTTSDHHGEWNSSIWIDFYRNVKTHFSTILSHEICFFRYFIFTSFWAYKVKRSLDEKSFGSLGFFV